MFDRSGRIKLPKNTHQFFGYSDDNIEVRGQFEDEFGFYNRPGYIEASDGTIIKGEYDPPDYRGRWKFEIIRQGPAVVSFEFEPAPDDEDNNSDQLTIVAKWDWITSWEHPVPASHEYADKLQDANWAKLSSDELRQIWLLARKACQRN